MEYFNFSCDFISASFPYLSNKLLDKLLIVVSTFNSLPGGFTNIFVFSSWYWSPDLSMITLTIFPFSTTALNLAPVPDPIPTTSKSGGSSQATFYNIYSCGCDASANQCSAGKNSISILQSTVTVTN